MAGEDERWKRVESLGWLTESSVVPKKHKAIEGVGASSIVELKAQLYRTQEQARKAKESAPGSSSEFLRAKRKPSTPDLFSQKNFGVESRAKKDKLEMKAANDGLASYAALERKARLYEKLARGELPDEEKYRVDFFYKSLEQDEPEQPEGHDDNHVVPPENEDGGIDVAHLPFVPGHTSAPVDNDEHKRFIREESGKAKGNNTQAAQAGTRACSQGET